MLGSFQRPIDDLSPQERIRIQDEMVKKYLARLDAVCIWKASKGRDPDRVLMVPTWQEAVSLCQQMKTLHPHSLYWIERAFPKKGHLAHRTWGYLRGKHR